ncbi:hypothetical protein BGW41_003773 [Actinomortierella wolfii]|nr:hypothetical protein BGW41_003773 [Actinomortierella wolfii]
MQAWKAISHSSLRNAARRSPAIARVPQHSPLLRQLHHQSPQTFARPLAPVKTYRISPQNWTTSTPMSPSRASQLYLANGPVSRLSPLIRRGFASEASHQQQAAAAATGAAPKPTVSQRIKDMIKKYGYTALAVYLGISTLDLAATFVVVQALGMDKIKVAEDWVKENVGPLVGYKRSEKKEEASVKEGGAPTAEDLDKVDDEQMGAIYNTASSLWSVFVIAYGIHKLLVPLRVVATSFITPPLVKWLVARGWIRDVTKKAVDQAAKSGALVAMVGLGATNTVATTIDSQVQQKEEEQEAIQQ